MVPVLIRTSTLRQHRPIHMERQPHMELPHQRTILTELQLQLRILTELLLPKALMLPNCTAIPPLLQLITILIHMEVLNRQRLVG